LIKVPNPKIYGDLTYKAIDGDLIYSFPSAGQTQWSKSPEEKIFWNSINKLQSLKQKLGEKAQKK